MTNSKLKKTSLVLTALLAVFIFCTAEDCDGRPVNTSAKDEQAATEVNQRNLNATQPPPKISWSLERDSLIKKRKLENDRTVNFYMYVFIEGNASPIGYYLVNKVSSVDSQLTNTDQIVHNGSGGGYSVLPSPSEDGSYGTNGEGVFGFTPDEIYIQTNMKYLVSTVPLAFPNAIRLAVITSDEAKNALEASKKAMSKKE